MPLKSARLWKVRAMPMGRGVVRLHRRARLAAEGDRALLRAVDAVDHVQHRALAGAVRADDGADLVLAHVEAHVGERLHAAEGERDALERRGSPRRACARRCPARARAGSWRALMRPPARPRARRSSRRVHRRAPRARCPCGRPRSAPAPRSRSAPRPSTAPRRWSRTSRAMKPRRTLRVRVSSPSSASSSLCRITKRWIWLPASLGSRGEVRVHLLDALADQLAPPAAWRRGRCSPSTGCRGARPSRPPPACRC